MKYQLIEWESSGKSIYEVTDDLSKERLIWIANMIVLDCYRGWTIYQKPINTKATWITKEEVFAYML